MSELRQRILTAIAMLIVVFTGLFWCSEGVFRLILTATLMMVALEYQKLLNPNLTYPANLNLMVMLLAGFGIAGFIGMKWLWWLATCWWILVVPALLLEFSKGKHFNWLAYPAVSNFLAILMFVGCYAAIIDIRAYLGNAGVLYLLMISTVADSAAYFVGKKWGKHPFASKITSKTLEGVAGGLVAVLVLSIAIRPFLMQKLTEELGKTSDISLGYWLLITVWLVIATILGDLWESVLKRRAGVKDSGNLLPGHGGFYDRLDSLIAVAPVLALGLLV